MNIARNAGRPAYRVEQTTKFSFRPLSNIHFLIHSYFFLILLEGIFRKWLFNNIEQPLTLIRDPVALLLIFEYLRYKKFSLPRWFSIWAGHILFFFAFAILQGVLNNAPPIALLVGMRNYFLFIPVAFIMAETFDEKQFSLFVRYSLILAIPVAYLVFLQYKSPVSAAINKGISDDVVGRFTILNGIVRPYGVFTFTAGHVVYALLMASVGCASVVYLRFWKVPLILLVTAIVSILILGLLSGSRTYFMGFAGILATYILSAFLTRQYKLATYQVLAGAAVIVAAWVVLTQVFPVMYNTMLLRQSTAVQSEGATQDRLFTVVTGFLTAMPNVPLWGEGIGLGTNAGAYLNTGARSFVFAEYEWTRIIFELGPIVGLVVILERVALGGWLLWRGIRSAMVHGSPGGLILAAGILPNLVFGQLSAQNSILAVTWFGCGLAMALNRISRDNRYRPKTALRMVQRAGRSRRPAR